MAFEKLTATWSPRVLSVLRIMSALIFMEHGTLKLLGFPASDKPVPELLSLSGISGMFELFYNLEIKILFVFGHTLLLFLAHFLPTLSHLS